MKVRYGQAGYDGCSMSHGAVGAYAAGKMPASKLALELGIPVKILRSCLDPSEWHHTGKFARATDFYDPPDFNNTELVLAVSRALARGGHKRSRIKWLQRAAAKRISRRFTRVASRRRNRASRLADIPRFLYRYLGTDLSPHSVAAAEQEHQKALRVLAERRAELADILCRGFVEACKQFPALATDDKPITRKFKWAGTDIEACSYELFKACEIGCDNRNIFFADALRAA